MEPPPVPPGFEPPDLTGPLDLEARLASTPPATMARGFFLLEAADFFGIETRVEFYAYRSYPAEDYLRLIVDGAGEKEPKRQLLEFGRRMIRRVGQTRPGRIVLALAGDDPATMISQVERTLRVLSHRGKARIVDRGPNHARYELDQLWTFPSILVGCSIGAFEAVGATPRVYQRSYSLSSNEHFVTW